MRTCLRQKVGEHLNSVDTLFTTYLIGYCSHEPLGDDGSFLFDKIGPSFVAWGLTSSEEEARELCADIAVSLAKYSPTGPSTQEQLEQQRAKISQTARKETDERLAQVQRALEGKQPKQVIQKKKKKVVEEDDGQKFVDPDAKVTKRMFNAEMLGEAVIFKAPGADMSGSVHSLPKRNICRPCDCRPDEIRVLDFSLSYGGRNLLSNASLTFQRGRRYGIIGRNGRCPPVTMHSASLPLLMTSVLNSCLRLARGAPAGVGKSTLLRHLARGAFQLSGNPDILYIEQEVRTRPAFSQPCLTLPASRLHAAHTCRYRAARRPRLNGSSAPTRSAPPCLPRNAAF